jgi:hypothetical protein
MGLDIQKVANESDDGTFSVRTNGLHAHRHAELEIAPLPRAAVQPAAKLIDYVIDAVVAKGKQLRPLENVGLPLAIGGHEEIPAVFVGVHATEHEAASGGFFAKMRGSASYGTLRLIDFPGSHPGPPLNALATIMLYRANCRFVTGDADGARQELRESIEMTPGDPNAGPPPALETDSQLNWQNHLSYLRLAELADAEESNRCYRQAFSRFTWLARRELGCSPSELARASEDVLIEGAKDIIRANLANPGVAQGPHDGLRFVASPLWVAGSEGNAVREASLIPAGFVDYYFGARMASPDVTEAVARIAAQCVVRNAAHPWVISFMTKSAREMYTGSGIASTSVTGVPYRPWHFLLSAVIAEATRYLRADATDEELRHTFGLTGGAAEPPPSLQSKIARLETWETNQYSAGIGVGILDPF